jgi:N-acetylmuramoyl-L-alanine amidase
MKGTVMAPRITKHLCNVNCTFINQMYKPLVFMVHRTAGHTTNQQLLNYWNQTCQSSHFGINWTGDQHDIWQFVDLWNGAGANCCPEAGCHQFFARRGGNANTYTISVEVCTPNTANQGLMQQGQEEALIYLIRTVCKELGIPTQYYSTYWNGYEDSYTFIDTNAGGVGMHRDTNPRNKRMCPGDPYYQNQMKRIMDAVNGGTPPPQEQEEELEYMATQLEENIPATLIFAGGNRKQWLRLATDHSDANIRLAFHIINGSWNIQAINIKPGQNCRDFLVGPGGLSSDYVSIVVTEFNVPNEHACAAAIVPY